MTTRVNPYGHKKKKIFQEKWQLLHLASGPECVPQRSFQACIHFSFHHLICIVRAQQADEGPSLGTLLVNLWSGAAGRLQCDASVLFLTQVFFQTRRESHTLKGRRGREERLSPGIRRQAINLKSGAYNFKVQIAPCSRIKSRLKDGQRAQGATVVPCPHTYVTGGLGRAEEGWVGGEVWFWHPQTITPCWNSTIGGLGWALALDIEKTWAEPLSIPEHGERNQERGWGTVGV